MTLPQLYSFRVTRKMLRTFVFITCSNFAAVAQSI